MEDKEDDSTMNALLTVDEAAKVLRLNPYTVRKFLRDGKLKGTRIGERKWGIRRSDIEAYIDRKPVQGEGDN